MEVSATHQPSATKVCCSKIPTMLQGPAVPVPAQLSSGNVLEARLAQKLRSQISPSRIPRLAVPRASDLLSNQPLQPTAAAQGQHTTERPVQHSCHSTKEQQRGFPHIKQGHKPGEISPSKTHKQQGADGLNPSGDLQPWSPRQQQQQQQLARQDNQHRQRCQLQTAQQNQQQHPNRQIQPVPYHELHDQPQQKQQRSLSRALHSNLHSTAVNSGWAASQKLHEFLLHQQHKREQYWLSKYGKMLGTAANQSLGKPRPNPAHMFRHAAVAATYGRSAAAAAISRSSSSPLKLPPLYASHSQAPIGAVLHSSSVSVHDDCNAQQPPSTHAVCCADADCQVRSISNHAVVLAPEQLPPTSSASVAGGRGMDDASSSSGGGDGGGGGGGDSLQCLVSSLRRQQPHTDTAADEAFECMKAKVTLASVPKLSVATRLGAGSSPVVQPVRQLPCRDLAAELQVLRGVHGREDALDKLKACCNKITGAAAAGHAGCSSTWLLPSGPMGRLFYRLVANYRQKTLEFIMAHAAWQRKVSGPAEPYSYKGRPYLLTMGEGLEFLDDAPWLAGRLVHCKVVQDVLLAAVTPDGVPLDGATNFDLQHGPSHSLHPEALRIYMARKVLAAAGAPLPPDASHCLSTAWVQQLEQQQQQACARPGLVHQQEPPCVHLAVAQQQHAAGALQLESSSAAHEAAVAAAAAALSILSARNSPREVVHAATVVRGDVALAQGENAAAGVTASEAIRQGIGGALPSPAGQEAPQLKTSELQELSQRQGQQQAEQHADQLQQQGDGQQQLVPAVQGWLPQLEPQQVSIGPYSAAATLNAVAAELGSLAEVTGTVANTPSQQHQQFTPGQQQQQQLMTRQEDTCSKADDAPLIDEMLDELVAWLVDSSITASSTICTISSDDPGADHRQQQSHGQQPQTCAAPDNSAAESSSAAHGAAAPVPDQLAAQCPMHCDAASTLLKDAVKHYCPVEQAPNSETASQPSEAVTDSSSAAVCPVLHAGNCSNVIHSSTASSLAIDELLTNLVQDVEVSQLGALAA